MKIGVIYPQTEMRGDPVAVRSIGLATEASGFDCLVAYDHVLGASHDREPKLNGPYTERDSFRDPLMMFSYLAGITEKIEFVTGVLILPQRQTVLVARQAADLDILSLGRLSEAILAAISGSSCCGADASSATGSLLSASGLFLPLSPEMSPHCWKV